MTLAFGNVSYDFYSDSLGRSAVPDEASFEELALAEKLYVDGLYRDGLIAEREENGIDSAVCLMVEEEYKARNGLNASAAFASESIGEYSYARGAALETEEAKLNAESTARRKYRWLSAYCDVKAGRR